MFKAIFKAILKLATVMVVLFFIYHLFISSKLEKDDSFNLSDRK